jgi:hypothetical protein
MMSAPAPYPAVQSHAPAPDDAQIINKTPSICVDYLSHNWREEDVWSSWKAMTKVSRAMKARCRGSRCATHARACWQRWDLFAPRR